MSFGSASPTGPGAPVRLPAPPPFELWRVPLAAASHEDEALLDDQERERATRFAFERDRRRYVAAHSAVRRLLGRRTGCSPAGLRFEIGEFGKPRLPDHPRCSFSLSHSGDQALVALADGGEIGVDLEQFQPLQDVDALALECLSEQERLHFDATPPAERALAFLHAWTRKEACLKVIGTGLQVAPASVGVGLEPGTRQVLLETPAGIVSVVVHSFAPMPGWIAALARAD